MDSWRTGVKAFRIIAVGQFISLLGGAISSFALTIWAFEKTGSATALGLLGFFNLLPFIITSPFAGAIVDRSNRRLMMMLSDIGSFSVTLIMLLLQIAGWLEIWHLYAGMVVIGVSEAFQTPAFTAAMTNMVPENDYPKANAALSLAESARSVGGPAIAAVLYPFLGLTGVLAVDTLTFVAAFAALLFIAVPQPPTPPQNTRINWLEESTFGFKYIWSRPALRALVTTGALFSFAFGIAQAVEPALVLSRGNQTALAILRTAMGVGGILGGLAVSTWGAPKRRIVGSLLGMGLYSSGLILMGLAHNPWLWGVAGALTMAVYPLSGASSSSIWQRKVDPAVQGRVRAARQSIAFFTSPLGTLLAGPLADRVLTPGMRPGGAFTGIFGGLVGTGPGAGFALTMLLCGLWIILIAIYSVSNPMIRNIEDALPDHKALEPATAS